MPDLGTCRGCGKAILWSTTAKGKLAPFDAKPTIVLFTEGMHGYAPADGGPGLTNVHTGSAHLSHFITCPQRDQFRKKLPEETCGLCGASSIKGTNIVNGACISRRMCKKRQGQ